jgi:hypothetical protein
VNDPLLDPVREPSRVETVLELPGGGAVETHLSIFSGKPHDHQTIHVQDGLSRNTEGRCGERPFFL